MRVKDQATGTAFICIPDDAENAITDAPGANLALAAADLLLLFATQAVPTGAQIAALRQYCDFELAGPA